MEWEEWQKRWTQTLQILCQATQTLGEVWGESIGREMRRVVLTKMERLAYAGEKPPDRIEHTTAHVLAVWKKSSGLLVFACDVAGHVTWIAKSPPEESSWQSVVDAVL